MVVALLAAPLLAYGRPDLVMAGLHRQAGRSLSPRFAGSLPVAWIAFAVFLWLWHAPAPYEATLRSTPLYWHMHGTLLVRAYLFWHAHLVASDSDRVGALVVAGLTTSMHMSLLGAMIRSAAPLSTRVMRSPPSPGA